MNIWLRVGTIGLLVFAAATGTVAIATGAAAGWPSGIAIQLVLAGFTFATSLWCLIFDSVMRRAHKQFEESVREALAFGPKLARDILLDMKARGLIAPEVDIDLREGPTPPSKLN